jgi:uncharacterized paraquat-inducible protein A
MTFKTLQIIFLALLLGQLAFAIIGNMILNEQTGIDTGALIYFVPVFLVIMVILGFSIFNSRMAKVSLEGSLEEKFNVYRNSSIIRWSMIEIGNLLAIVAAIVEGNSLYLMFFAVGLIAFATTRPNIEEFTKRFKLSQDEQRKLLTGR